MKINPSVGFDHYKTYMKKVKGTETPPAKGQEAEESFVQAALNTDKVVFSDGAAVKAESNRVAKTLAAEVEKQAAPQRLAQLQISVQNGTYFVQSEEIAQAILGMRV